MEIWFLEDKKYDFVLEIGYHTNFFLKKRKNKKIKKNKKNKKNITSSWMHTPPSYNALSQDETYDENLFKTHGQEFLSLFTTCLACFL